MNEIVKFKDTNIKDVTYIEIKDIDANSKDIIDLIYSEPWNWKVSGRFIFLHVPSGTEIWANGGLFFHNLYPVGNWNLFQKLKFAKAFRWWCGKIHTKPECVANYNR